MLEEEALVSLLSFFRRTNPINRTLCNILLGGIKVNDTITLYVSVEVPSESINSMCQEMAGDCWAEEAVHPILPTFLTFS